MVRPRLVEEGTPIGQADDDHHADHEMAQVDQSSSFEEMGYTQQSAQHQATTSHILQTTATTDKPSSLFAAAKGKLPSKRHHHAARTRVIIGGESPDSLQPDCIDMTTDEQQNYNSLFTSTQPMHQYQQQQPRQYSSSVPAAAAPPTTSHPRKHIRTPSILKLVPTHGHPIVWKVYRTTVSRLL
jgi:hypothetical protein